MLSTKSDLSPERRSLIERMQALNFGCIRNIEIRGGEPRFTPATTIQRLVRLGGQNQPRPEVALDDFVLKDKIVQLFDTFDQLGEGRILKLTIKAGLPFDMTLEEPAI